MYFAEKLGAISWPPFWHYLLLTHKLPVVYTNRLGEREWI